jgi:ElaB/YqjD/DUF883 family membrane-anchored ribosome-binding protein
MTDKSKRPGSIDEAMKILDEALKGNTEELKDLVSDELQTFKAELGELSSSMTVDAIGEKIKTMSGDALSRGQELFTEATAELDARVRKNPWPAIGGVAVGTFALGYLLGKKFLSKELVEQ